MAATDHHPLDVTAHPDVAMAIGHRHRVGLVTDQRLRAVPEPGRRLEGRRLRAAMASRSRVRRSPMAPAQDMLAAAALLLGR